MKNIANNFIKFKSIALHLLEFISFVFFSLLFYLVTVYSFADFYQILFALQAPLGKLTPTVYLPFVYFFVIPFVFITAVYYWLIRKVSFLRIFYLVSVYGSFLLYTYSIGVFSYFFNDISDSDFIKNNYVAPNSDLVNFPQKKRNLIHIYLESMENAYTGKNGGAYNENFIPELTKLALNNISFNGENTNIVNGSFNPFSTSWTMAAIFAQESGVPLKISIGDKAVSSSSFYDKAVTLGNLLAKNNYHNVVIQGHDMVFANSEIFHKNHGYQEILDYKEAIKRGLIPSDYRVWWGFEDKKLFQLAKNKLVELSKSNQPFNLSLLTVDTHFEDGYLDPDVCENKFNNKYKNVLACSSKQVSEFVTWVQQQDFYKDTVIVISGDHLMMGNPIGETPLEGYEKTVYTAFINSVVSPKIQKRRSFSTFDFFPTILASLGCEVKGDRLGLGVNLFGTKPTLLEQYGKETLDAELMKHSTFMEDLAGVKESILIEKSNLQAYLKDLSNSEKDSALDIIEIKGLDKYFEALEKITNDSRYVVMFSLSNGLSPKSKNYEKIISYLNNLELKVDFSKLTSSSYAALINSSKINEKFSETEVSKLSLSTNNHNLEIVSGGLNQYALIKIDDVDYSKNMNGLNIVVYDAVTNKVLSSTVLLAH